MWMGPMLGSSTPRRLIGGRAGHRTVRTIRADGSGLTKVFEDPGAFPIDPVWSPDGSQIMFMLDPISDRFTHPNNDLYVMRSDGTELTKLIATRDFKSSPEWWSPR